MEESQVKKPTRPRKKRQSKPKQSEPERLDALRKVFVSGAVWDEEGRIRSVTFFPPNVVLEARRAERITAPIAAPPTSYGMHTGEWDETPEMQRLRAKAEDASLSMEERDHYARQHQALLKEAIMYHSS